MLLISTSEDVQKGWVMEVLSFRMRAFRLQLRHVLISMRIGNEAVSPYCAVLPSRANLCATERKAKFKTLPFFI